MDIWYIYTLSHNGSVFYVGISKNVGKRFRGHLSCQDMCTGDKIYWIRHAGELPTLEILNAVRTQREAEGIETSIIRHLCIMHNKLCNVDINPNYNRLITCNPNPNKERLIRIKKGVIDEIIRGAKDRFHKLTFYYYNERKTGLQYMGNAAIIG